jgi:hypothetical protein
MLRQQSSRAPSTARDSLTCQFQGRDIFCV